MESFLSRRLGLALFLSAIVCTFVNFVLAWALAGSACFVLMREADTRRAARASFGILVASVTLALFLNGFVAGAFGQALFSVPTTTSTGPLADVAALLGIAASWMAATAFAMSRKRAQRLAVAGALIAVAFLVVPTTAMIIYTTLHPGSLPPKWLFALQIPAIIGLLLIFAGLARDWPPRSLQQTAPQ